MNKGIVIDIKDSIATVMSSEGCFQRIKAFPGCYQGMEMVYSDFDIVRSRKNKKQTSIVKKFSNIAVAAVIGIAMISSSYVYYDNNVAVYAAVTVDVNPSMQFDIGKNSQVVGIHEFNKDAETLLDGLNLKGQKIDQAIKNVEVRLEEKGYFNNKNNYMLVGYAGVKENVDMKNLQKIVSSAAIETAKSNNISLDVKSVEVSAADLKNSIDKKTSVGRQAYVSRLKENGIINKNINASTAKISNLVESQNNSVVEVSGVITNVTSGGVVDNNGNKDNDSGSTAGTPSVSPTDVLTPAATNTPSVNNTSTPNTTPTVSPTNTFTPTPIPTVTPTATPTNNGNGGKTEDNIKYNGKNKK